jgi:putative ubiquitin-RnfH superfamily antitoxin RatB of RatAB toxin-antitoxin module
MENKLVTVMIAYATPQQQWVQTLHVHPGSTVEEVLMQGKNTEPFNQLDFSQHKIGIFGKEVPLTQEVKNGDRIEIYRALIMDPMTARRKRAEQKKL